MTKIKEFEKTPAYNIERSLKLIMLIEQYFPLIKSRSLSERSFVVVVHRLLPYRLLNTAKPAIDFVKQKDWIPSALLARACAETTAIIYALNRKAVELSKTENSKDFELFCAKTLMASKYFDYKDDELRAPNILTYIQRMENYIPEYYNLYKVLSEYCHPNVFGWYLYAGKYFNEAKNRTTKLKGNSCETALDVITVMLRLCLANAVTLSIETERILEKYYKKDITKTQSKRLRYNSLIVDTKTIYQDFYLHNLYLLD